MTITIIPRAEWKARAPKRRHRITTPTPELWLHHTAGNHVGATGMRAIQNFHMDSRGWSDIAYSYCIDRVNLDVYEARGAGIAGGHTRGHNTISHAICVFGNFETIRPTSELLDLIAELVAHGHTQGWWPDQLTGGHRDASGANTACPGRHLYAAIPEINRRALNQEDQLPTDFIAKIKAASEHAEYTPTDDLDQLAENMTEISAGLMKSLAREADLKKLVERYQADRDFANAVRALVQAEQQ